MNEYDSSRMADMLSSSDGMVETQTAEDGIRDCLLSRGLGDVYKRQGFKQHVNFTSRHITTTYHNT